MGGGSTAMTRKLLTSIASSAILIAAAATGLRQLDIGASGHRAGRPAVTGQAQQEHPSQRGGEQQQATAAHDQRKLAEARRQAGQDAQQREAQEMGLILSLRHEDEEVLAEAERQAELTRRQRERDQ